MHRSRHSRESLGDAVFTCVGVRLHTLNRKEPTLQRAAQLGAGGWWNFHDILQRGRSQSFSANNNPNEKCNSTQNCRDPWLRECSLCWHKCCAIGSRPLRTTVALPILANTVIRAVVRADINNRTIGARVALVAKANTSGIANPLSAARRISPTRANRRLSLCCYLRAQR